MNINEIYEAYERAKKEGPSDKTRKVVLSIPYYAYHYARYIDKKYRDDTRNAILKSPAYTILYAENVDKKSRKDTRNATLPSPIEIYDYAKNIDKYSKIITRKAAMFYDYDLKSFEYTFLYIKRIDKKHISYILI